MIVKKNEFGVLQVSELNEFENENNVTLPEDYRHFLLEFNGGEPVLSEMKILELL